MERIFNRKLLAKWIKENGKSKAKVKVAYACGVSVYIVEQWLTDEKRPYPRIDEGQNISNVTGIPFNELFPLVENAA